MNVIFLPFPKRELESKKPMPTDLGGGRLCVVFFSFSFFSLLREINHVICCPLEFIIFFKTQTFLSKCTGDKNMHLKGQSQ